MPWSLPESRPLECSPKHSPTIKATENEQVVLDRLSKLQAAAETLNANEVFGFVTANDKER